MIAIALFSMISIHSKSQSKPIMKVTYKSVPYSQYQVQNNDNRPEKEKGLDMALSQGHQSYFELLIDLKTLKTVYEFDTLIVEKPVGRTDQFLSPPDKISYVFKEDANQIYKQEEIFGRKFFTYGSESDILWDITDETKTIMGLKCQKAVSKNKTFLITAWFTKEIPVSSGPSNYSGLPGLILLSEDFFRTISAQKIEYPDNANLVNTKLKKLKTSYEKNKNGNESKEALFLLKKADLVKSMRRQMNN